MLTIYHAPQARSHRIIWLCEEMGVPYAVKAESFGAFSPEFLEINPLRSLPAMRDGDVTMIESIAMMMYIMAKHGPTPLDVKPEEAAYPRYLQFLMFGEAGMAMYGNPLVATKFMCPEDQRASWTADYLRKTLGRRVKYMEAQWGEAPFIVGDRFTAADISVGYSLGMMSFAGDLDLPPRCAAYVRRLAERPAYQRALARN